MRKSLSYFLLSLLLLLYSCDVGLHDNFVEIEPLPTETPIYVNLDLEADNKGVLQILENANIHFQISTPETEFLRATFYINDMCVCETRDSEGFFQLSYYSIPKEFQIKCIVNTVPKEPGHSISDQINTRLYEGEIKWDAHVISPELRFYQNPGDITPENITVRWETNVPNCFFGINYGGETLVAKTKETSISLPTPPLGSSQYLEIEVFSQNGEIIYLPYTLTNFQVMFGTSLKGSQMTSIYSLYSNTLYASMYGEVTSYSIPELTVINEYKDAESYGNATPVAVAPNSDKIAVRYNNFVSIFMSRDLKQQIKIYNPDGEYSAYKVFFTTDDKLAITYRNYSPKVYLYNASNGKLEKSISISTFNLEKYNPDLKNSQMSEHFLCVPLQSTYKLAIIPLQDFEAGEPIMHNWSFQKMFMYPNSPDKLILDKTDQVDIIDCQNGQIIQSVFKDKDWIFCNIDPKTGNYLFQSSHYLTIRDKNGEELFHLENENMIFNPHLDNNILTCSNGIALNVEPYLKRK